MSRSHKRAPKTKIIIGAAAAAAVVGAAIVLPNANASQDKKSEAIDAKPKAFNSDSASDAIAQLASSLGEAFGGAWYDKDQQQVVVNVIGDNNNVEVAAVKSAGAVPRPPRTA